MYAIDKQVITESMKLWEELNYESATTYAARTVFDMPNLNCCFLNLSQNACV